MHLKKNSNNIHKSFCLLFLPVLTCLYYDTEENESRIDNLNQTKPVCYFWFLTNEDKPCGGSVHIWHVNINQETVISFQEAIAMLWKIVI